METLPIRNHSLNNEMVFEIYVESTECGGNDGRTRIADGPYDDHEMGT
jgi:hypothetical protein